MGQLPIYLPIQIVGQFVVDPFSQAWFAFDKSRADETREKPLARDRETPAWGAAMNAQELLQEISDYCRQTGLAESTFGRRAVNDGKLASRLRHGGRITTETLDRIRSFMAIEPRRRRTARGDRRARPCRSPRQPYPAAPIAADGANSPPGECPPPATAPDPQRNFRFFDNRQKYLLFVNTCSEKWVVANRVALELANIHPRPPAVRLFDAGVGDGTVLLRVMRAMHDRFPHTPFYVVGKEISLEDVRLALQKMSDRFTRASGDRAGADQPRLCRRAVARGEVAVGRLQHGLARGGADRLVGAPVRAADHRSRAVPRRELEGRRQPEDRQPGLRAAGGAGDLSRGPQVPARPDHPEAGRHAAPTTTSSSPRSPIARAPRSTSRPSA